MLNLLTDLKLVAVGVSAYLLGIVTAIIYYEVHRFYEWITGIF